MPDGDINRRIVLTREEFDRVNARLDAQGEVVPELMALIERVKAHRHA